MMKSFNAWSLPCAWWQDGTQLMYSCTVMLLLSPPRELANRKVNTHSYNLFYVANSIHLGGQPSPAKNPSKMFASSTRSSAPVSVEGSLLKKPALYASDKSKSIISHKIENYKLMLFFFSHSQVPVLDGRGTRPAFNLGSDLDNLGAKLPEFHNEVPAGSFAWVGYSVNAFRSQKGDNFAMNLLWVVVVGTPAD